MNSMNRPRFLLSKSKLLEQYSKVKELAGNVSYSVKTNPTVAEVLEKNTGSWFTIHSTRYLDTINDMNRVWFVGQAWNNNDINFLFEKGLKSFIVDNERDLEILIESIEKNNKKINLLLRMKMKEYTIRTERHFVYGMYSKQINNLIPKLRNNPHIEKLGVHFHRKTQNISEWSLKEEVSEVLNEETLKAIDIINIGGGLPVDYRNYTVDNHDYIFEEIRKFKEWINEYGIQMFIEPGRFIAAPCIKLETEIIAIYENNIIVNCSVYNSAMDTFVAHIRLLVENEMENNQGERFTIKGFTPDSTDVFRYRVYLNKPKVGDKIIFLNAGAYTYSTDFLSLEKPETVIVE